MLRPRKAGSHDRCQVIRPCRKRSEVSQDRPPTARPDSVRFFTASPDPSLFPLDNRVPWARRFASAWEHKPLDPSPTRRGTATVGRAPPRVAARLAV